MERGLGQLGRRIALWLRGQRALYLYLYHSLVVLLVLGLLAFDAGNAVVRELFAKLPGGLENVVGPGTGLAALLGLAVVVAAAASVMGAGSRRGVALLLVALVTMVYLTFRLPDTVAVWLETEGSLDDNGQPRMSSGSALSVAAWVRLFLAGGLAYLLAKLALLRRLSANARTQPLRGRAALGQLLPSQQQDLWQLASTVASLPSDGPGAIVQFYGRWGEGKSFLLSHLGVALQERHPRFHAVVTFVDVWKSESEPDLHLTIVEQMLSHPRNQGQLGWLHHPLLLLTGAVLRELRLDVLAKFGRSAEVNVPVRLPRLLLQRPFERSVARLAAQGFRQTVVLDEIDRSTPQVAQAAMTIVRRSLDQPGVTVVLSYVDAIIRFKAFNPFTVQMPDLRSTMLAAVYEDAFDVTVLPQEGGTPSKDGWLDKRLLEQFASAEVTRRAWLEDRFVEKYLGTLRILMTKPTTSDIAALPIRFETLRQLSSDVLGLDLSEEEVRRSTEDQIRRAVILWDGTREHFGDGPRWEHPPIRALQSGLFSVLSVARGRRGNQIEPGARVPPEYVAALLIAVSYIESIRHGRAGDTSPDPQDGEEKTGA